MRIYTRAQLEAFSQRKEFLLMNASKSGDHYAEYSGVSMEELLADAGISDSATGITVFAPMAGRSYYPLRPLEAIRPCIMFFGTYPERLSFFPEAVLWCDYSAPSCAGRNRRNITVRMACACCGAAAGRRSHGPGCFVGRTTSWKGRVLSRDRAPKVRRLHDLKQSGGSGW